MQLKPNDIKINKLSEKGNVGVFTFEPLPTGFGHTLGNTIRRVLLTSLEGAAVTQVKIKGASHQFASIEGIKEDVVDIILNVKGVRAKLHTPNPVVLRINKKGVGPVTAGDIETNAEVEIINKDHHIATVSDKTTSFEVELVIESGVGYSPIEDRESSKIGIILVDAMFSPVILVNYVVEPTRLGRVIGLDKLTLTVETDGSLTPEEAFTQSATILRSFFARFADGEDEPEEVVEDSEETSVSVPTEDVSLDELPLPTRTINALKKHGISTLHDLAGKSDEELADVKNLGEKSVVEIKKLLSKEGLAENEA